MGPYGTPGSATYAVPIDNIENMLTVLPDNTGNQITAKNVRDVVAGLWDEILGLSNSVTTIGSSSSSYTNTDPSSVAVGGLSLNSTFTNISIQDLLDDMLYPYTAPTITLSASPTKVEYGNTSQTVVLSWSTTARKNNIVSSLIYRPLQLAQSVTSPLAFISASGSVGSNQLVANTTTTFTFSISDLNTFVIPNTGGPLSVTKSVTWGLKRFYGTVSSVSSLATTSTASFAYSDVSAMNSDLNTGYTQSVNITTSNDYVVFIWPSNAVSLIDFPPKVSINGLANNDWTKTRDGVVFTNQYGYTASYDVWRFNHIQAPNTFTYIII